MEPSQASPGFSTRAIHAGTYRDRETGGACSPVFTSTAFAFPNAARRNLYPRFFNTPNQEVVCRKIAALEHGETALAFGSGMAAISTTLLAHLNPGDHAVFQSDLYGGTVQFVTRELQRLGVAVSWGRTAEDFAAAIRPETRILYVESPSNPLLRCVDLPAIARLGRDSGALTVVDNTFATPINQNPLTLGIDAVVHSATKYLNGHSDVNAGFVVASEPLIRRVADCATSFGGMLDARACALLERGMKTLAIRVERHNESAARLARCLAGDDLVARVNYPGLETHADHPAAARQMKGFGGMLSFELSEPRLIDGILNRLRIVQPALSLGGVESLICVPSRSTHAALSPAERERAGIGDGLVRLSVGIEDIEDLIDDLRQAFSGAASDRR